MQVFDDDREARDLDVLDELAALDDCVADEESGRSPALTEGFVHEVLVAVADMALRSKRRQADLDAALWSAGMVAAHDRRLAALERLREQGCVDKVVELSDGGVLLSVTALGLDRLGGAGR
jgi:hypothetical protein